MSKKKAVVVLSGGQDSTTCAFWAKEQGYELHAITFDYGQRHKIELEAARKVGEMVGVASHEFLKMPEGVLVGSSPLVNEDAKLEQYADMHSLPGGLEKTFVPMRNQLFLTIAANRAHALGCDVLVTGVCQEDSGGYPDCREDFIRSFATTSTLGTFTYEEGWNWGLRIFTPLMNMTKAESVQLALSLPGCYEALAYSHTAYDGLYPPTGNDHASLLRAKGFAEAGVPDPLVLRAWHEGHMWLPNTDNYSPAIVRMHSTLLGHAPGAK